jgi:hypothetical protein
VGYVAHSIPERLSAYLALQKGRLEKARSMKKTLIL